MKKILPVLKNSQEYEMQKNRGLYVERLFDHDSSPFIMLGIDKGTHLEYSVPKNESEKKLIRQKAIENLQQIDVPVKIETIEGVNIALINHEYAAEKILDKNFMRKLSDILKAKAIVVGIPIKGLMLASPKGKGEIIVHNAVINAFKNPPTYPISNALYFIMDGEIEMMGGTDFSESSDKKDEVFDIIGNNDKQGKVGFTVKIGHKNEDELVNQIQNAYQNILMHVAKSPKTFNGKIDFIISPEYTQLNPQLENRIKKIAKNISERGAIQIIGGISGEQFKIKFYYGDKLIAETIETDPVQLTNKSPQKAKRKQNPKKPWWKFW